MKRLLTMIALGCVLGTALVAQTMEELKAELDAASAEISAIRISALKSEELRGNSATLKQLEESYQSGLSMDVEYKELSDEMASLRAQMQEIARRRAEREAELAATVLKAEKEAIDAARAQVAGTLNSEEFKAALTRKAELERAISELSAGSVEVVNP